MNDQSITARTRNGRRFTARSRRSGGALAIIAGLATIAACATAQTVAPEPSADSYRVLSWNVNYGLAGDNQALAFIRDADADIVLLQETNAAWHRQLQRGLKKEFKYQRHHDAGAAGGLSVLSRFPIISDELIANDAGWFPAQRTVLKTPVGKVQTLNVHLRPPLSESGNPLTGYFLTKQVRGAEILIFLQALDPELPTIVAGDFNETEGQAVERLHDDGFASALALFDPGATTWRWPVPVIGEITGTLDHIFVDARLQTVDAWVLYTGRSDHYPILAWVQPPSRQFSAKPLPKSSRGPQLGSGYSVGSY